MPFGLFSASVNGKWTSQALNAIHALKLNVAAQGFTGSHNPSKPSRYTELLQLIHAPLNVLSIGSEVDQF